MKPQQPAYTEEVQRALRAQAIQNLPGPEPVLPAVPEGHVRYLIQVGESYLEGIASPAVVAASLRAQAEALDPTRPHLRSTK